MKIHKLIIHIQKERFPEQKCELRQHVRLNCLQPALRELPTAYCLLPTAYCLLPTAYCLLLTVER
jgi:hypothetical protein